MPLQKDAPTPSVFGGAVNLLTDSKWLLDAVPDCILAPRGLANAGNLCFANSVLQALLGDPRMMRLVKMLDEVKGLLGSARVARSLREFVAQVNPDAFSTRRPEGSPDRGRIALAGHPIAPTARHELIESFVPEWRRRGEQQDVQEFLAWLIDALHEDLLHLARSRRGDAASGDDAAAKGTDESEEEWLTKRGRRSVEQRSVGEVEETAISLLARGRMVSSVSTSNRVASVTLQPFTVLGLHLLDTNVRDLKTRRSGRGGGS